MRTARICRNSRDRRSPDRTSAARVLIAAPDAGRFIDLPGAGACPRPVDLDGSRFGFATLVALRVYSFARGKVIHGASEGDEVFIVLLRGAAEIAVERDGADAGTFDLTANGARALYLPPLAAYRLTAREDCDIAYARARPSAGAAPAAASFTPAAGRLDIDHASAMTLTLARVATGERHPLVAPDGASPERFVHVRSETAGRATIGDVTLTDWDSAALDDGESATLTVAVGAVDMLLVSAAIRRDTPRERHH